MQPSSTCFAMGSSGGTYQLTLTAARLFAERRARRRDVLADLRDQRLDGVEPRLAAQPLDELDLDPAVVEVAREVEDVGLERDRGRARVGEGRVGAEAGRGQQPRATVEPEPGGVDAGRGEDRDVGRDVRGRDADRAAALGAVDDGAVDAVRAAEQLGGGAEVAGADGGADPGRGDRLA